MEQSSSHLSRYRPAVLALTSVAAAYGVYVLYNSLQTQPLKNGLRRSNAIHRPRPERPAQTQVTMIGYKPPTEEAFFGTLVLRNSTSATALESDLANVGLPAAEELEFFIGEIPNVATFTRDLHITAVESVLHAALLAQTIERREKFAERDLDDLPVLMAERNVDLLTAYAPRIQLALANVPTLAEIDAAIAKYTASHIASDALDSIDPQGVETDDAMTFTETEDQHGLGNITASDPSQGLKGLLYHIAEADAKRKAYEHRGISCEGCGERPIKGVRWHCMNCPDFDLCSACEAHAEHQRTHVFAKIKIPLPVLSQPTKEYPLWYPGDPRKSHSALSSSLKKRLGDEYGFDGPHMDAHYDQFTSMANVPWQDDPNRVMAAIDRRAFNKALTCDRWPQRYRPTVLYDRMFAFYDTNRDGLIGFEEFLSGLAYLRGPKRFASLHRALQGFDIDGDGYVSRRDFHRIFRAKHEIQKLLIESMIQGRESEITRAAMETLRSSLPISSIFSAEEIPQGEERQRVGKVSDRFGDLQPSAGSKVLLDDDEGWPPIQNRSLLPNGQWNGDVPRSHESQHHFSRFEEMLDSPTNGLEDIATLQRDVESNILESQQERSSTHDDSTHQPNGTMTPETRTTHSNSIPDERPLDQDTLWQIVEESLWEMFDPLFQDKEREDGEVIRTREERQKWRKEIEEAIREKEALKEELRSAPVADPLMATAMDSIEQSNKRLLRHGPLIRYDLMDGVMRTDPASLERLEAEIAEQPLEDLLDDAGYSVVDDDPPRAGQSVTSLSHADTEHFTSDAPRHRTLSDLLDDTGVPDPLTILPDHSKPPSYAGIEANSDQATSTTSARDPGSPSNFDGEDQLSDEVDGPVSNKETLSKERLEILVEFHEQDREIKARGGIGKLSYEEIEEIVQADETKELKGLVTSWLEWASF